MKKSTQMALIGAAVAVVIVIAIVWFATRGPVNQPGAATPGAAGTTAESKTKMPVPAGVSVPGTNSQVSGDVAKPTSVAPAAPGATSQNRTFSVAVNNDTFTPAEFIGYVNDIVTIHFTAVDKDYDVTQPDYGYKLIIPKGQTKLLQGQFTTAGKFVFYCASCGGPDKGPVGYFVAVPK